MYIASNIPYWLPSTLKYLHSPKWMVASWGLLFLFYGTASAINMLILKRFVFEKEINSEAKVMRTTIKNSTRQTNKNKLEIAEQKKRIDSLEIELDKYKKSCESKSNEISGLNTEIDTLQIALDATHGSMKSAIRRYAESKASAEKSSTSYNQYESNEERSGDNKINYNKIRG